MFQGGTQDDDVVDDDDAGVAPMGADVSLRPSPMLSPPVPSCRGRPPPRSRPPELSEPQSAGAVRRGVADLHDDDVDDEDDDDDAEEDDIDQERACPASESGASPRRYRW